MERFCLIQISPGTDRCNPGQNAESQSSSFTMPSSYRWSSAVVNASRSQSTAVGKSRHRWFGLNEDDEPVESLTATSHDSDQRAPTRRSGRQREAGAKHVLPLENGMVCYGPFPMALMRLRSWPKNPALTLPWRADDLEPADRGLPLPREVPAE
jgi:hypothetical protein